MLRVRDYETTLILFGALFGVTWAAMALFALQWTDGVPAPIIYTLLLPVAAAFQLRFGDIGVNTIVIGMSLGAVAASAMVAYWRLRYD